MTQTIEMTPLALSAVEYFKAKLAYEMTPYALKGLLIDKKAPDLLVLDVRSTESFNAGHVPGALNIPLMDLAGKLATLPKDKTIVTYCSTITCGLAPKAALVLAEKGFKVMEMYGGFATWTEHGFPVEKKA
ncbi:MAG: rhodanese [Elusimicrobia bacterium CG11_big_fil_rev_8_21_14_0_20_64_6]|nr:MAG: rhodanese [Elusimicrobia bacterium CG11_big_fil_rev_8_21_14_0_20_64_6]